MIFKCLLKNLVWMAEIVRSLFLYIYIHTYNIYISIYRVRECILECIVKIWFFLNSDYILFLSNWFCYTLSVETDNTSWSAILILYSSLLLYVTLYHYTKSWDEIGKFLKSWVTDKNCSEGLWEKCYNLATVIHFRQRWKSIFSSLNVFSIFVKPFCFLKLYTLRIRILTISTFYNFNIIWNIDFTNL